MVNAAADRGVAITPVEFAQSTRTAAEAADAAGVTERQIVKSLVFECRSAEGSWPVVALVNGASQCDTRLLGQLAGGKIRRCDADAVREATGFAIGGVAPCGYPGNLPVFIDDTLATMTELWAACGTPHVNFRTTGPDLVRLSAGTVGKIVS